MYVKITSGAVDQYPYTVGDLRRDNPNTSFPKTINENTLKSYGIYSVRLEDIPSHNERTQNIVMDEAPRNIGDEWVLGWTVTEKTQAEIDAVTENISTLNRQMRDYKIAETDWWASSDLTMTAEQTAYRQALRDITSHTNWPHLDEADWPTKP